MIFLKKVYVHERHTERGRDTGRGGSRLLAGSPTRDSIPGPRDRDLSRRQMLDHGATRASLKYGLGGEPRGLKARQCPSP